MEMFVLFADMLGFEHLVENDSEPLEDFTPVFRPIDVFATSFTKPELLPTGSENMLRRRFVNFHRCLHTQRQKILHARDGVTIVFSDSAFLCTSKLDHCFEIAKDLMRALITCGVPARMGVGRGTFRSLRFLSDISEQVRVHESQFLGTGITRAHGAEQCGAKGLRILLHPSVMPYLTDKAKWPVVEANVPGENKRKVDFELNYAYRDDEDCDSDAGPDVPDFSLATQVKWMNDSAKGQEEHYAATIAAFNRMRAQYGREPYPDFEDLLD